MARPLPQQGFQEPSDDDEAIAQAHSDEPVYIYDTQGKCRWVNRSGESLLGVDASQIIGRYIFELFPGQARFQIKAWRRVIDAKEPSSYLSQVSLDGEIQKFQTSLLPVMDNAGRVQSVVSVGRWFAEQEELQHENKMQGAELALIYEIASILTSSLDLDEVYGRFAAEFKKLVDFDRIIVMLLDETKEKVIPAYASSALPFGSDPSDWLPVASTGLEWVINQNSAHIEDDLSQYQEFEIDESLANIGIRSILRVPLIARRDVIGQLVLCSFHPSAFDEKAHVIAEYLATQISPAIENARLYKESQAYAKELEVIDEVARIVSSSLNIAEVYQRFYSEVKRLVNFQFMSLGLVDEDGQQIIYEYSTFTSQAPLKAGERRSLENSGMGWAIANRTTLIENDIAESGKFSSDDSLSEAGVRSAIRIPFISKERVIGAFALYSEEPNSFGPRESRILERLAAQIAPAVENARLYEEVQQAMESLRSTQEQLVRVERLRAMGELASGVAHDFNNSLAAILNETQLLIYRVSSEPYLRSLRLIEQSAHDSARVVKRILDFARFESETDFGGIDVNRLVEDSVELTRHKWSNEAQSKGKVIKVTSHLGEVPLALGNFAELSEVLTNMVINACEAIPGDGEINISTESLSEMVRISVSDSGMGMSPEVRQKVFDPFFTTKGSSGTGLGLSVAFGIISRHNGVIDVESKEGEGTTFHITLPITPYIET
ncbi:MAG: GAF domain-containing protein, partial [Chloroflexi bacterium]|nr:GAF domain-containing protein [Chloroflexota bacterium]